MTVESLFDAGETTHEFIILETALYLFRGGTILRQPAEIEIRAWQAGTASPYIYAGGKRHNHTEATLYYWAWLQIDKNGIAPPGFAHGKDPDYQQIDVTKFKQRPFRYNARGEWFWVEDQQPMYGRRIDNAGLWIESRDGPWQSRWKKKQVLKKPEFSFAEITKFEKIVMRLLEIRIELKHLYKSEYIVKKLLKPKYSKDDANTLESVRRVLRAINSNREMLLAEEIHQKEIVADLMRQKYPARWPNVKSVIMEAGCKKGPATLHVGAEVPDKVCECYFCGRHLNYGQVGESG